MPDDWPNDDVLLMLVKESAEHKRAWALISGLSKTVLNERNARERQGKRFDRPIGEKPDNWADRIQHLERRLVKQRKHLAAVEECRVFERETEDMLVGVLKDIAHEYGDKPLAGKWATDALNDYLVRRGPRPIPVEWGPDSPGYDEMGQ